MLPFTFAVITVVPAFLPVTLPFEFTVAIFLFPDFHVTFLEVPLTVAFNRMDFPTYTVPLLLFNLIRGFTVILNLAVFPFAVAVIVVIPSLFPITFPFEFTVAIFLFQ